MFELHSLTVWKAVKLEKAHQDRDSRALQQRGAHVLTWHDCVCIPCRCCRIETPSGHGLQLVSGYIYVGNSEKAEITMISKCQSILF